MPFGIDIKFVPLTPGIRPRSEPVPSSPFPDLSSFEPMSEEELANLRRNTEIFLKEFPTWNDQWVETTRRSQSVPQLALAATYPKEAPMVEESHFGPLEGYDPEAMLTDEPSSYDIDPAQLSELQQLCVDTFPNGVPEETDAWSTLAELTDITSSYSTSAVLLDDIESFFRTFQSMDDLSEHFDMTDTAVTIQG